MEHSCTYIYTHTSAIWWEIPVPLSPKSYTLSTPRSRILKPQALNAIPWTLNKPNTPGPKLLWVWWPDVLVWHGILGHISYWCIMHCINIITRAILYIYIHMHLLAYLFKALYKYYYACNSISIYIYIHVHLLAYLFAYLYRYSFLCVVYSSVYLFG